MTVRPYSHIQGNFKKRCRYRNSVEVDGIQMNIVKKAHRTFMRCRAFRYDEFLYARGSGRTAGLLDSTLVDHRIGYFTETCDICTENEVCRVTELFRCFAAVEEDPFHDTFKFVVDCFKVP